MSAARRMRIFAWSLPISGLVAGYGSLLILWSLDDLVSTMLHRYPAFVVLALKAARSAGGDSPDMPFPGTRR